MAVKLLNRNNFLIWEGEFNNVGDVVQAIDDAVSMVVNGASMLIQPLLNDIATTGINASTLLITVQDNIVTPATWDAITQKITYYPPAGSVVGDRVIKYKWRDNAGVESNEATITISLTARPTGWRGYAPSRFCITDLGDNTGFAKYADLEKYYTDDNTAFLPQELKDNDIGDPDYIAPVEDLISCPLPAQTDDFAFYNYIADSSQIIWRCIFTKTTGEIYNFKLVHSSDFPQPKIVQVPLGDYTSIVLTLRGVEAGKSIEFEDGVGGSGGSTVVTAGPDIDGNEQITWLAVTLGADAYILIEP